MLNAMLKFFGYIKIPKEAVRLSMDQESFIETQVELTDKERLKQIYTKQLEGQKTLTAFLRSGRL